jgi:dynein heavy chain
MPKFSQDYAPFPVPKDWHKTYVDNKLKIERTLHVIHPVMRKLLTLWDDYNHVRLIDVNDFKIHQKTAPFRMTAFRSMMLVQSERCREKLLN